MHTHASTSDTLITFKETFLSYNETCQQCGPKQSFRKFWSTARLITILSMHAELIWYVQTLHSRSLIGNGSGSRFHFLHNMQMILRVNKIFWHQSNEVPYFIQWAHVNWWKARRAQRNLIAACCNMRPLSDQSYCLLSLDVGLDCRR